MAPNYKIESDPEYQSQINMHVPRQISGPNNNNSSIYQMNSQQHQNLAQYHHQLQPVAYSQSAAAAAQAQAQAQAAGNMAYGVYQTDPLQVYTSQMAMQQASQQMVSNMPMANIFRNAQHHQPSAGPAYFDHAPQGHYGGGSSSGMGIAMAQGPPSSPGYMQLDDDDDHAQGLGSTMPYYRESNLFPSSNYATTARKTSSMFSPSSSSSSSSPSSYSGARPVRETKAWVNPLVTHTNHEALLRAHPGRLLRATPGKKGNYFCSHCSEQFRTIMLLAQHMDQYAVRRQFHCVEEDCPWWVCGFATASEWSRHTKSQHGSVEMSLCHVCHKPFTRKDSLKRHCTLVHDNENSRFNRKKRSQEAKKRQPGAATMAGLDDPSNMSHQQAMQHMQAMSAHRR